MTQAGPQTVAQQTHAVPDVGQALRARREELGWSLTEVAGWLRIKLAYLQALEDGRPQDLPGSTYALGFLRSYAAGLGLDAEELAIRFRVETKGIARPNLSFPAPVPERGVPAGAAVLLGVLLLGAAYTGWYMFGDHERLPTQTVPPPPAMAFQSVAPQPVGPRPAAPQLSAPQLSAPQLSAAQFSAAQSSAVQPPMSEPAASGNFVQVAPPAAIAPVPVAPGAPLANAVPAVPAPTVAAVQGGPDGTETTPPSTSASAQSGGASEAGVTPAVVDPDTLTIRASAASWVQVRKAGGPVIYERILQPGESWSAPAGSGNLLLSTGNAGGVTVSAGDATTPALGRYGAVRRNLPLSVASVRDGSLAAAPPSGQTPPILAGSGARKMPVHTIQPQPGHETMQPQPGRENDIGQDGGQSNPEQ